jgi:TetR/AcrR family acrAB operon transcriptional repressor
MGRKSKEEALETRRYIVLAALSEFEKRGVSYTTLKHIADAAGVTRGAIYWHFKNKNALFNEKWALANLKIEHLEMKYKVAYPRQPLKVMYNILVDLLSATQLNPSRKALMEISFHKGELCEGMLSLQQIRKILALNEFDMIENTLEECVHHHELPETLDIHSAALLLHACIVGVTETWLLMPERFDLVKSAPIFINAFISMLKDEKCLTSPHPLPSPLEGLSRSSLPY